MVLAGYHPHLAAAQPAGRGAPAPLLHGKHGKRGSTRAATDARAARDESEQPGGWRADSRSRSIWKPRDRGGAPLPGEGGEGAASGAVSGSEGKASALDGEEDREEEEEAEEAEEEEPPPSRPQPPRAWGTAPVAPVPWAPWQDARPWDQPRLARTA